MPYSFETWFLTDRPGVILGRREIAYPLSPFFFKPALYVGTDGRLRAPMFEVDRTAGAPVSSQRVDDGKFHHAAVTYDGGTLRLYVDGVLQAPVITNATSRFGSLVDTLELGTGYSRTPGLTWPATSGGWMSFFGFIDEPAAYKRALGEAEIRAINQAGEIGKANAPVVNVTLPAGRVAESYLTSACAGMGGPWPSAAVKCSPASGSAPTASFPASRNQPVFTSSGAASAKTMAHGSPSNIP